MARARKSKAELLPQSDPTAPLDVAAFLAAAQPVLAELTNDLLARADADAGVRAALQQRHEFERKEQRTGDGYEVWRRNVVVQIAAGWLLSCVFVRTLEDRGLLGRNRIAGPGAVDSQEMFHRLSPHLGEREYLLMVFREMEHFQAARGLFDRQHNLAWRLGPSSQSARSLLVLFRGVDPEQPAFRFGQAGTRFLGDIYQDLSEEVRKRFALLQTPDFIESFILDRTLDPAIEEFGLDETTVIDPTCGSGHFLLGAFERLYDRWCVKAPGESREALVERALAGVFGVDVNPYAVAIARFRLTLAALDKLGVRGVVEAPLLSLNVVVADSLLHNYTRGQRDFGDLADQRAATWYGDVFALDDEVGAKAVLSRTFAAVVGNPPYITVKDKALRDRYRRNYSAAHREYSLSVPFMQRFFDCARVGGFVGQITSNSFMKREFGKLLIEEYLPTQDLRLIVNTSGAFIPGHGTPTVLVFGRARTPERVQLDVVLARRGEPSTPDDPARGLVWRSIADHWNEQGFENEYITVGSVERGLLANHPWSLEGGGAGALKSLLETRADRVLSDLVEEIGFGALTRADDVYFGPRSAFLRANVNPRYIIENVEGGVVRDWSISDPNTALFPYEPELTVTGDADVLRFLWRFRTMLWLRREPNGNHREIGLTWQEWSRFIRRRFTAKFRIAFAFVATHNHFVLDRGGRAFNRTAPIIKLFDTATEDDHLALLAYLNSSVACFWMKQVAHDKGNRGEGGGVTSEEWERFYEFDGTKLMALPMPQFSTAVRSAMIELARAQESLASNRADIEVEAAFCLATDAPTLDQELAKVSEAKRELEAEIRANQEKIDWIVYNAFGLTKVGIDVPSALPPGLRASDVLFAEAILSETASQRYFTLTNLPGPEEIVAQPRTEYLSQALTAIAASPHLRMLETPKFKRTYREGFRPDDIMRRGREWLAAQIEAHLKDAASEAVPFTVLRRIVDQHPLVAKGISVADLLSQNAIPYLASLRFTAGGIEKHDAWQRTWDLQRREDADEKVGTIPVPPKYDQTDYGDTAHWRLRGKLDVPNERFISYPGCESDQNPEPIYGWAGWDHLQRAQALATLYRDRKTNESWPTERLLPMLAGIHELIPWLKQWHNEPHPEFGPQGDFFDDWLSGELREHKLTRADLEAWRPSGKPSRKKTSKNAPAKSKAAEPTPEPASVAEAVPQAAFTLTAPTPPPKKPRGRKKKSSS